MIWLIFLFSYLFFFTHPLQASEPQPSVVIVNQVRGSECCEPGSLDNLRLQLDIAKELNLPMTFALRFDALTDPVVVDMLKVSQAEHPDLIRLGAFLEITPAYAHAAHVLYTAQPRDWYKLAHVYPPGYSVQDRTLLLDTYMRQYSQAFGTYPELTVGWFVDTHSLNYLHEQYGVKVHELTREQWGTDSYTLSGGPIHYPYTASRNWAFIPGDGGLAIIRQTVEDPLQNYGDQTSSFTSQPNDYGRDKGPSYFEGLLSTALKQPGGQPGFAVLGLETSMANEFQTKYLQNLRYLASTFPNADYPDAGGLVAIAKDRPVNLYAGQGAFWISTPRYRIRLLTQGNSVQITDLRLYDPSLTDPYLANRVKNGGFFITPYLIDGSRWYSTKSDWFQDTFKPQYSQGYRAHNDVFTHPTSLLLPSRSRNADISASVTDKTVTLTYSSSHGLPIKLEFTADGIRTEGLTPRSLKFVDHSNGKVPVTERQTNSAYNLEFSSPQRQGYALKGACHDAVCNFGFSLSPPEFALLREELPFLFIPGSIDDQDTSGTLVYPSLVHLITSRSPARVVVIPRNSAGLPVSLGSPVEFEHPGLTLLTDPQSIQGAETQLFDFTAPSPGRYVVKTSVPGLPLQTFTFVFAPDCRISWQSCLKDPGQLADYIFAVLAGKWQKLRN